MNPEGRLTFANAEAERLLGLARDEVVGRMYNDAAWKVVNQDGEPVGDDEMPFAMVKRTGNEIRNVELHVEVHDKITVLSVNAAPLQDERGHLTGVVATLQDLTEIREANKKLGSMSGVRRVVLATDDDLQVLYWGRNAAELFGLPSGGALGKPVSNYLTFVDGGDSWESLREKLRGDAVWKGELELRHPEKGGARASVEAHRVAIDGTHVVFLNVRLL